MIDLESIVAKDSYARLVDVFVDALPLEELGFSHNKHESTGRPPYHPAVLLKLYMYGYRHGIRSRNKLHQACLVNDVIRKHRKTKVKIPSKKLSEQGLEMLDKYKQTLILKGYSPNTLHSYCNCFIQFLVYFENADINQLTKDQIEAFVFKLKSKYRISEAKQSLTISAMKFYYEKVLSRPKEVYNITRPKQSKTLPNVLSKKEIKKLLKSTENLKHRVIITLIYAAGLRISEVPNIRVDDIQSDDGYIFIRGSKQKKDRHTVLSPLLLDLLRIYYKKYKPAYWLFEGMDGGQYSISSIRKIC